MEKQNEQDIATIFSILSTYFNRPRQETWSEVVSDDIWKQFLEEIDAIWGITYTEDSLHIPRSYPVVSYFYNHHLSGGFRDCVVPVESVYKPWTADKTCRLPFARSTGYVMGDSALHIKFLLEEFQMNLSEDFHDEPDHLAILLELLSYFYHYCDTAFILDYLTSHFDWLRDFEEALLTHSETSPFHLALVKLLIQIIDHEKVRLEMKVQTAAIS